MLIIFKLFYALCAVLFLSSACYAPPTKEEESGKTTTTVAASGPLSEISVEKPQPKQVTAKARLSLAQQHLKDPAFSPDTKVTTLLPFYQQDMAFILAATSPRSDASWIKESITFLDREVQECGLYGTMSYRDYLKISACWAEILSLKGSYYSLRRSFTPEEQALTPQELELKRFLEDLAISFRVLLETRSGEEFRSLDPNGGHLFISTHFLNATHMVIPHTSKTGSVPIPVFDAAAGFWRDDEHSVPYNISFVGIGTDPDLSVHGERGRPANEVFDHDVIHMMTSNEIDCHPDLLPSSQRAYKIASLKDAIAAAPVPDSNKSKMIMLACFICFHEGNLEGLQKLTTLGLEERIKGEIGKIDALLADPITLESERIRLDREITVKAATSLQLPLTGEILEEQVQSYLELLRAGYELLLPHAHAFDEAG